MAENTRTQELLSKIETLSQEEFDELIELVEGQPLDLEYDVAIMKRREELQQQTQTDEGYPLGYEFSEADFAVSGDDVISAEETEPEPIVEEIEPDLELVLTPEKSPQEKAQEILETLRNNPNAQIEGVDLATASTLNNMANDLGVEDLYIMEAIDNVVKHTYNNLSEDEKADLEPEVREAMESRVNEGTGTIQDVGVGEPAPENVEPEPEPMFEELQPEHVAEESTSEEEPVIDKDLEPEPELTPQEKAQEVLNMLRSNPNAKVEGVDIETAAFLNEMANDLGMEDLHIMEAVDNIVKNAYNNLSEDEKADLEPEVREAMESRVNEGTGTIQDVGVGEPAPENVEPEPEPMVEEPQPEPVAEESTSEEEPVIDKESLFQSFDKLSYEQLTMTLKAARKENDYTQIDLIEEYVELKAKEVNEGKKLILDIKDSYKWQEMLNATYSIKPEILTALVKVDQNIASFEEEYGIDNEHLQSDEQIATNYDELKKLEKTDFFARIDKPNAATWTGKEFDNWRKKTFIPVLQAYAGALRSPEYNNLSPEEKNKLLDEARLKIADLASLDYRLTLIPFAYGDLRLIVDELKKNNPDNVAVKNADAYLQNFYQERNGFLYPEMKEAQASLEQINVKGDLQLFGRKSVKQDSKDSEIARLKELARIETEVFLANTTPPGSSIDARRFAEEYAARLNKHILAVAQADRTAKGATREDFNKLTEDLAVGKIDINQSSFTGYYAAQVMRHMSANDVLESKRPSLKGQIDKVRAKIAAFDKSCTEQYGNKYTVAKNVLKSLAWGAAFVAASTVGPAAMAAVATVSFANQAWGICKDFKTQKAKLAIETDGKRQLTFREYAKNNKLRMAGAFLSASTVAISGLGAMGVAVGPLVMKAKSAAGISLALAGASKQAAIARQQVIEANKHLPKYKQKSVFAAGLKAYVTSAVSFGASMLGGQMGAEALVGAGADAVVVDNVENAGNSYNQPVIDTQTPTHENTNPTQVMDTVNREQVLDSLNREHIADTVNREQVLDSLNRETVQQNDSISVRDTVADSVSNVTDSTSVTDSVKIDDTTLQNIQDIEDKILANNKSAQDTNQPRSDEVIQENTDQQANTQNTSKEFWDNRADKFLGEDIKNSLYSRIDSGEIKLPEGIETKEEFAYKLAMAMEQSPAYVADALGVEFQTTAQFESQIQSMTPEQFAKLGDLMNDYSDRGNYIGDNPFETTNIDAKTENQAPKVEPLQDNLGKPIESEPNPTIVQATVVEAPITGIDIVQPSADDRWLPGDDGFVEKLHNLSSEIRDNNAMVDNSNSADTPRINYEVYETDVLGNKLDPQIQQDIIDTANTYGRRLDAMVERGYGTHEHFYHQGWSTDRYRIGDETFEISRDTGADTNGRLVISHDDGNGTHTSTYLDADGTSQTQVNRSNEPSIITHRDANGNVIDDTNSVQVQEGQQQAPVDPQQEQGQDNAPRLNLRDEYLKDVKDLGFKNPRSLSLHATEQKTLVNGDVISGYSYYARFDRCDNGYSATNHDGALGLVFDDKGNGTFKISKNDIVRPMTFEEAQSFVKTISILDVKADITKLNEALYATYADMSSETTGAEINQTQETVEPKVETNPENVDLSSVHATRHISGGECDIRITDGAGNVIFDEQISVKPMSQATQSELLPDNAVGINASQLDRLTAQNQLRQIWSEHSLYEEILAKENPTAGERVFISEHEQSMKDFGVTRTDNGMLVRTDSLDYNHKAGDGVVYECNKGGVEILKDGGLSDIEAQDKAYQDMKDRYEDGYRLNALEKEFMRNHEETIKNQHMYHDAKGNLVKLPEEVSVTKDGAAYRIQANIVSEPSAYGMQQQDYLSDAKELLGGSSKAADRMAVKSFLMNDDIYGDLKARQEAGETFSTSEQAAISRFMTNHEQAETTMAQKYGLVRGDDGEMHKTPNFQNTSARGVTQPMPIRAEGRS
ncbi:MAG: hypothetical protein IJ019_02815 [Alphaproteobacteria bacterium]|nr:hypothetical protein [Alphaproteobacteria bacterium]